LNAKLTDFRRLVNEYNGSYLNLARVLNPLIEETERNNQPDLTYGLAMRIGTPRDRGGAHEWAFMLLLGADEDDLEGRLDIDQKDSGVEIAEELRQNPDVTRQVTTFQELCNELEDLLESLKTELERLMIIDNLPGKCGDIAE